MNAPVKTILDAPPRPRVADFRLKRRTSGLFAWSAWDVVSVVAAFAHLAFVVWVVAGFSQRPWWANAICGVVYAVAISWNINGVSHNFLHTPYFRWKPLNYAFSLVESVAIGFSQTFYTWVHLRHHEGNSDRPGPDGTTRDWLSIYRHGKDGQPEPLLSYVFLGFFRGDGSIYQALKTRKPFDAMWGRVELAAVALFALAMLALNWKAVLFLLPFYYLGDCLSQLNGYYEHLNGNPDEPIAWGVSTYAPFYNWLWFNNGHHAEHHYRPAVHWTRLPALRRAAAEDFRARGGHVIETSHALGFLAPANRRTKAAS
jgi:fatty acid desaturase